MSYRSRTEAINSPGAVDPSSADGSVAERLSAPEALALACGDAAPPVALAA